MPICLTTLGKQLIGSEGFLLYVLLSFMFYDIGRSSSYRLLHIYVNPRSFPQPSHCRSSRSVTNLNIVV